MNRWLKTVLLKLSRSARFQRLLERNVDLSQYLMGIGSGSSIDSSGEMVLIKNLKQLHASTRRPLCVFDVGSNRGQFLNLIVDGLQATPFHVHAFEPSQHTFGLLHRNFKNHQNLFLNNFGLGKERGQFDLFYNEAGSGLASLSKRRLDHIGIAFQFSEKVTLQTLDDYCATQGIETIDLLKVDVEGHELDVLTGGMRMFRERKVRMVSFEFGGTSIDTRTYFKDYWHFFQDNRMDRIYRITPSGLLASIPRYREECEQFRPTNFLVLQSKA